MKINLYTLPANHKDQVHDFCVVWCLFQTEILTHFPLRNYETDDKDLINNKKLSNGNNEPISTSYTY